MQKISSIHQFNLKIQQILGSHELKRHPYPKIIEATFSFPKFVASCKKSVYSNCSFLRYINFTSISQTLRLITPILDHSHPKFIDQNSFFFWISLNMQKITLFQWFVLAILLFYRYCNLIGREHFDPYPRNKIFN